MMPRGEDADEVMSGCHMRRRGVDDTKLVKNKDVSDIVRTNSNAWCVHTTLPAVEVLLVRVEHVLELDERGNLDSHFIVPEAGCVEDGDC